MSAEEFGKVLKKTISPGKCREFLVGSEYLSDVTLMLGSKMDPLHAHKFFLMTASPVFHVLFSDQPASEGVELNIKISSISKATMIEICRFAYTETVRIDNNNMLEIWTAARELQMAFLVEKVIAYISNEGMNEHTVFKILGENCKKKNMVINIKCFNFIQKNHQNCIRSDDFLMIPIETLKMLLQACKFPQTAAKEAIALWTANPDNGCDEMDELIELASLLDLEEEVEDLPANNGSDYMISDSESNASRNSRGARGGRNAKSRDFRQNNQMGNQYPGNSGQNNFSNPRGGLKQSQRPPRPNQRPPVPMQRPQDRNPNQGQLVPQTYTNCHKNFTLQGSVTRKKFQVKYANLNLSTLSKPIAIHEINFIYDLSTTEQEFEIWVTDMTKQKEDLFYDRVSTSNKTNGKFQRYTLPRPCQVDANRKIWIRIEFTHLEYRLSLNDDYSVAASSNKDGLALRHTEGGNSAPTIISNIAFSDL